MFRAIACHWSELDIINQKNQDELKRSIDKMDFIYGESSETLVKVNGINYTSQIRQHSISQLASDISKIYFVRTFLLDVQRKLALKHLCVMEGRDIGTIVFPNAFCKVYLTATLEERTKRRYEDLKIKGQKVSIEVLKNDLKRRDQEDSNRAVAPLKQAEDAFFLDSSFLTQQEVAKIICEQVKAKANIHGFAL